MVGVNPMQDDSDFVSCRILREIVCLVGGYDNDVIKLIDNFRINQSIKNMRWLVEHPYQKRNFLDPIHVFQHARQKHDAMLTIEKVHDVESPGNALKEGRQLFSGIVQAISLDASAFYNSCKKRIKLSPHRAGKTQGYDRLLNAKLLRRQVVYELVDPAVLAPVGIKGANIFYVGYHFILAHVGRNSVIRYCLNRLQEKFPYINYRRAAKARNNKQLHDIFWHLYNSDSQASNIFSAQYAVFP